MRCDDFIRWTRGQAPDPRTPDEAEWEAHLLTRAKLRVPMAAEYPDPVEREAAVRALMGEDYPEDRDDRGARSRPGDGQRRSSAHNRSWQRRRRADG